MPKLFVICGHGAGDPGACAHGYQEAERVRTLGKRIKTLGGSKVILADTNRDYYADNGISRLRYGTNDIWIVELHMDAASASARGAHVIIKSGYSADKYDKALAKNMSALLPGRSEIIQKRSDLANVNRAAAKGYNYRLLECGFISNVNDLNIFNNNINKIAEIILNAFGIKANNSTANEPVSESKPTQSKTVDVDGWWGPKTTKALQKHYGTTQDSIISGQDYSSKKYHERCDESSWNYGSGGSDVIKALQAELHVDQDRYFGPKTIKALQKKLGVDADGYCGKNTVTALQKWINNGFK